MRGKHLMYLQQWLMFLCFPTDEWKDEFSRQGKPSWALSSDKQLLRDCRSEQQPLHCTLWIIQHSNLCAPDRLALTNCQESRATVLILCFIFQAQISTNFAGSHTWEFHCFNIFHVIANSIYLKVVVGQNKQFKRTSPWAVSLFFRDQMINPLFKEKENNKDMVCK